MGINYWKKFEDDFIKFDDSSNEVNMGNVDYETPTLTFECWVKFYNHDGFSMLMSWGDWNQGLSIYFRDDNEISINGGIGGRRELSYTKDVIDV